MPQEPLEATTAAGTGLMSSQERQRGWWLYLRQRYGSARSWESSRHKGRPCIPFSSSSGCGLDQRWGLGWHFPKWLCLLGMWRSKTHYLGPKDLTGDCSCRVGPKSTAPASQVDRPTCVFILNIYIFLSCHYKWSFWLFVWCLTVRILERHIHLVEASEVLRNIGVPY